MRVACQCANVIPDHFHYIIIIKCIYVKMISESPRKIHRQPVAATDCKYSKEKMNEPVGEMEVEELGT